MDTLLWEINFLIHGPLKCPDCCNMRSADGARENLRYAESDYFNKRKPEDGCHSEGQCDWCRDYGPRDEKDELLLRAVKLIEELSR